MTNYLQNLKRIEELVRSYAASDDVSYEEVDLKMKGILSVSAEMGSDIEIALRSVLSSTMTSSTGVQTQSSFTEQSDAVRLIKFALGYALANHLDSAIGLAKVPFLLIEDLLESQTIQQAKSIWKFVETWADKLTTEHLFSKGKFTMLKTCNSLLRKLSKSCDTEFCGRILLFLATIYPISERSALNVMGKVNVGNMTYFEDRETFLQNVGNIHPAQPIEKVDSEDGEEIESKGLTITYELYNKFWKLQNFFATECKSFDEQKDYWTDFMNHARLVIDTFEKGDQPEATTNSASVASASHAVDKNIVGDSEYSGCKFLTSSQLFSLQFRDPLVRQQVSIQLLYFVHYFRVKALPLVEGEKKNEYLKDISFVENAAQKLIESTHTSYSQDLVQTVQRILERETHWIFWKAASCQPFERSAEPLATTAGEKRKLDEAGETTEKRVYTPANIPNPVEGPSLDPSKFIFDCSDGHVQEVAQKLASTLPEFDSHIQQYLDADDPEAGIEEEYHPKHDQLYCWRTRRLLVKESIQLFEIMSDGDLGKGLRKLKNLPEPVPKVNVPMDEDSLDEEFSTAPREGEGEDKVTANDDAPMAVDEEAEAKSEVDRDGKLEVIDKDSTSMAAEDGQTSPCEDGTEGMYSDIVNSASNEEGVKEVEEVEDEATSKVVEENSNV
eukprot:gene11474-12835_t